MATELFANDATTTVSSGGTTAPAGGTSETWHVSSSAPFPAAATGVSQFHVADAAAPTELITVTNVSGTTWTVTRGAESTTPVVHVAGFTIWQVLTAGTLTGAWDAAGTSAAETTRAEAAEALLAPKASPTFTGTPAAPTAAALNNTTQVATTAYADAAVGVESSRAQTAEALAMPKTGGAFTGVVTSNQPIETTQYVQALRALINGETGAATAVRYSGANSSGAPATGSFTVGAVCVDLTGTIWICTVTGSPGTWVQVASGLVTTETARAEAAEALALPLTGGTMSGAIAMGSHKVTGLTNGSAAQDAAAFGQTPAGGAIVSGQLLATPVVIQPGTPSTMTVTGTALAALSSGVAETGTFTFPPSGKVLVTCSGVSEIGTGGTGILLALAPTGTLTQVGNNWGPFQDSVITTLRPFMAEWLITGTPGATANYDILAACTTTADTVSVVAQGVQGPSAVRGAPLTIKVLAI